MSEGRIGMIYDKAANFIWTHGRLLERKVFEYKFNGGAAEGVLSALRAYQNPDGGYGNALEPDLRAPGSQPLFIEFALRLLHEYKLRDPEAAKRVCDYLSEIASLEEGVPSILASSRPFPKAGHWDHPHAEEPSIDRLTGIVGLLAWQGISHPWLDQAIARSLQHLEESDYTDAHTILTAFVLLEAVADKNPKADSMFIKLSAELLHADFLCLDASSDQYGLSPLEFAPSPNAYCRSLFADTVIEDHLNKLMTTQQEDGGWAVAWEPPGETALYEWRAHVTLKNLSILRAYGRI